MNSRNENQEKIIAVGYTRVSTDRQVDGVSREVQDEKSKNMPNETASSWKRSIGMVASLPRMQNYQNCNKC